MTPEAGPPALAPGRMHEACGPAAAAFAAAQAGLSSYAGAPLLWILAPGGAERPDPYGLARFLDPGRLILVEARREEEVYWAMEEALRSGAAPFVIAEAPTRGRLSGADLTRSRRLQLAAETGGATGLLIIGEPAAANSNAAETRWRASFAPSPGETGPVWEWRLLKNKRGPLGCWRLRWLGPPHATFDSHDPNAFQRPAGAPHPLALAAPGRGRARAAA